MRKLQTTNDKSQDETAAILQAALRTREMASAHLVFCILCFAISDRITE
jgi:hypothetical protein